MKEIDKKLQFYPHLATITIRFSIFAHLLSRERVTLGYRLKATPEMSLFSLSDDALAIILDFLDGHDIIHLRSVGNWHFEARVKRMARNWKFVMKPFTLFPFSVYDGLGLASLDVSVVKRSHAYPLNLGNRALIPMVTQISLVSLKLDFPGSYSILNDNTLSSRAPNLQCLMLYDAPTDITLTHLQNLPQSLQTLELVSGSSPYNFGIEVPEFTSLLPPNLERAIFKNMQLKLPHTPEKPVKWPLGLRVLGVNIAPIPYILDHGPSAIEELHCVASWNKDEESISMSRFPRTLKILNVTHYAHLVAANVVLDAPMPPQLQTFTLRLAPITSLEQLQFLAPKMTRLSPMSPLMDSWKNLPHPKLGLGQILPNIENYGGKSLPKSDVPLKVKSVHLTGGWIRDIDCPLLPNTLTTLVCSIDQAMDFSLLPRSITELQLRSSGQGYPLYTSHQWRHLPHGLTSLSFDLIMLDSASSLRELDCTKLKSLFISSTDPKICNLGDVRTKSYENVLADPNIFQNLASRTLETLHLQFPPNHSVWTHWVKTVASPFPMLKRLEINGLTLDQSTLTYPMDEYLSSLPSLLSWLKIPVNPYLPIPVDAFARLPQSLHTLQLQFAQLNPGSDEPELKSQLTDDHFAHLPRKLSLLMLHSPISNSMSIQPENFPESHLTPQVISKLPPYLCTFPFSQRYDDSWRSAWAHYLDKDKWMGYPPLSTI